jgi:MFS family permease
MFSTIATTAAALYLTEIAPPLYRGTVAGMYNTLYYCGSMIATFCTYGTYLHYPNSNLSFRIPFWLQAVCPGIVALTIWFLPESPRWLIAKGRSDEARAFLVRHHANGDADHPIVRLEMDEMTESLRKFNLTSPREFFDIRVFFNSRSRRYRTFLLVCMSWFGQFSGNKSVLSGPSLVSPLLILICTASHLTTSQLCSRRSASPPHPRSSS